MKLDPLAGFMNPSFLKEGIFLFEKANLKFSFTKPPLTLLTKGLP